MHVYSLRSLFLLRYTATKQLSFASRNLDQVIQNTLKLSEGEQKVNEMTLL